MELEPVGNRSLRLPELHELPVSEWVGEISALYPDVVNPKSLQDDLESLEKISKDITKTRSLQSKGFKITYLGLGSIVLGLGSFPVLQGEYSVVGFALFAGGFLIMTGGMITASFSGFFEPNMRVEAWNNRGRNWLHQQRAKLTGS